MYTTLGCKDIGTINQSLWQRLNSCLYDRKPKKTSLNLLFQRRPLRQENIDDDDDVLNTNYFGEFNLVYHVFFHK